MTSRDIHLGQDRLRPSCCGSSQTSPRLALTLFRSPPPSSGARNSPSRKFSTVGWLSRAGTRDSPMNRNPGGGGVGGGRSSRKPKFHCCPRTRKIEFAEFSFETRSLCIVAGQPSLSICPSFVHAFQPVHPNLWSNVAATM